MLSDAIIDGLETAVCTQGWALSSWTENFASSFKEWTTSSGHLMDQLCHVLYLEESGKLSLGTCLDVQVYIFNMCMFVYTLSVYTNIHHIYTNAWCRSVVYEQLIKIELCL